MDKKKLLKAMEMDKKQLELKQIGSTEYFVLLNAIETAKMLMEENKL